MKRFLLAIVAMFLVASNVQAIEVNSSISGSWYNPEQSGHGFSIEVISDTHAIAYWYVYDPDGNPIFLITLGEINGDTISGAAYKYEGMRFREFNPEVNRETEWGEVSISFIDCENATLNYDSFDVAYGSGSMPLTKIVGIEGLGCKKFPLTGLYSIDLDPGIVIQGWADGYAVIRENGTIGYEASGLGRDGENFEEFGWGTITAYGPDSFTYELRYRNQNGKWLADVKGSGRILDRALSFNVLGSGIIAHEKTSGRRDTSYSTLKGEYNGWTRSSTLPLGKFTIDESGNVKGMVNNCAYEGKITVINPAFNGFSFKTASPPGCWTEDWLSGYGYTVGNQLNLIVFTKYEAHSVLLR